MRTGENGTATAYSRDLLDDSLPGTLRTLAKAGRVLDLFTVDRAEWRLTDVANELELSKSSAHSLLASMTDIGLLARTPTNRYQLGWRLLRLGETLLTGNGFSRAANRVAQELVERLGETIHVATLQGSRVVCVNLVQGTHPVRVGASDIGIFFPVHAAVSKILLASLPWSQAEKIVLANGLPRLTSRTITNIGAYKAELESVREQGYALDSQEAIPEVCCVAAPIRNSAGRIGAAISIAAPSYRFAVRGNDYRLAIIAAADGISGQCRRG